jgi:hypothetical protein
MAKKARTPPPPRQQGPKKRGGPAPARRGLGGQRNALVSGVLVGGAIVAAVLVLVLTHKSAKSQPQNESIPGPTAQMAAAGCTLKSVAPLPPTKGDYSSAYHDESPTLTSRVKWSTDPPAAGGHYQAWAVWGFYDTAVNPRQVVHNEEHGAMVMWWGDKVPAATVAKLRAFYGQSPLGMFGTPYPSLGNKIALTAWTGNPARYYVHGDYGMGHIAICPTFNQKAFAAFRTAYRGKGPEGVPLAADKPGTGPNG